MSFIKITSEHINGAEKFIRENVYEHLFKSTIDAFNESGQEVSMNEENVLISKEKLVEYFGEIYATQPQNFRFEVGDRILIEELVEHVKNNVTSKGKNGLKIYNSKKEKKEKKNSSKSSITEYDHEKLKSQLRTLVISCMHSHDAEQFFDVDLDSIVNEKAVDVQIKKGFGIFGSVRCLICDKDGKKKNKPKRVHYSSNSDWPCWVLGNFKKHLQNVHKLQYDKTRQSKQNKETDQTAENVQINNVEVIDELEDNKEDDLVLLVQEEEVEVFDASYESDGSIEIVNKSTYTQLSEQIYATLSATLHNSEDQTSMTFFIDDIYHSLKVAEIERDGNCLFSSIAHQLYRLKIGSRAHQKKTTELRARVVKHILEPANFPSYAYQLQECVYENMKKENIKDMTTECKLYVKLVLSKKGKWGGAESIIAISELEEVNIVIFNEDGSCYVLNKTYKMNKKYQRLICIAYRFLQKGDQYRKHYDSVCDIDSNVLNFVVQKIEEENQQN